MVREIRRRRSHPSAATRGAPRAALTCKGHEQHLSARGALGVRLLRLRQRLLVALDHNLLAVQLGPELLDFLALLVGRLPVLLDRLLQIA